MSRFMSSFPKSSSFPPLPVVLTLRAAAVPTNALCAGHLPWQWSVQLHDWHGNSPLNTWCSANTSVCSPHPFYSMPHKEYTYVNIRKHVVIEPDLYSYLCYLKFLLVHV